MVNWTALFSTPIPKCQCDRTATVVLRLQVDFNGRYPEELLRALVEYTKDNNIPLENILVMISGNWKWKLEKDFTGVICKAWLCEDCLLNSYTGFNKDLWNPTIERIQ